MKWLVLVWPFLAATSANRNYVVERIAIWHALIASYVAWGVFTGFWYPPHRSQVALFSGPSWLPWAGWGLWVLSVVSGRLAGVRLEHRFDVFSFAPWPARHRQASYVLAFFGLWMIGYGGHSFLVPAIMAMVGAAHGSEIFEAPSSNHRVPASRRTGAGGTAAASDTTGPSLVTMDGQTGNANSEVLAGSSPLPLIELRQAPDGGTVVVPRREVLHWFPATQAPTTATATVTEPARPVDDGSAHEAAERERSARHRAERWHKLAAQETDSVIREKFHQLAQITHDNATWWHVAGLARLRWEAKMAQRVTGTQPVRPLTKHCLPALLPMDYPADFRTLERWAVRVGATVRLGNGRTLNALGERWPMQRIDAELPALPLPQLIEVWLRTRALLAPDRLPGDDDWSWAREAPGEVTARPTAEFTIAMDGEVAIPARLVDVSDLRWLEELYAVEGSWTARQEAGYDAPAAGSDRWQAVQVAPADRRLLERHAFATGAGVRFEDGKEVNAYGERWSRQRIDAELPKLPDGGLAQD